MDWLDHRVRRSKLDFTNPVSDVVSASASASVSTRDPLVCSFTPAITRLANFAVQDDKLRNIESGLGSTSSPKTDDETQRSRRSQQAKMRARVGG